MKIVCIKPCIFQKCPCAKINIRKIYKHKFLKNIIFFFQFSIKFFYKKNARGRF